MSYSRNACERACVHVCPRLHVCGSGMGYITQSVCMWVCVCHVYTFTEDFQEMKMFVTHSAPLLCHTLGVPATGLNSGKVSAYNTRTHTHACPTPRNPAHTAPLFGDFRHCEACNVHVLCTQVAVIQFSTEPRVEIPLTHLDDTAVPSLATQLDNIVSHSCMGDTHTHTHTHIYSG